MAIRQLASAIFSTAAHPADSVDRRRFRESRLKLAIVTSIPSKVVTVAIQVVAMPIAARALGAQGFGVYAVLSAALTWVSIGNLGIGPGLTLRLTSAVDDETEQAQLFSTSFLFLSAVSAAVLAILLAVPRFVSLLTLFGAKYAPRLDDLRIGFMILSFVLAANILLSVVESARLGYQQQHINNIYGTIANILSLAAVLVVSFFFRTVPAFLAAVFFPQTITRIVSLASLVIHEKHFLLPSMKGFSRTMMKRLLGPGVGFLTIQIASFLCIQVIIIEVGHMLGPAKLGPFALMLQLSSLFCGVVSMIMQPIWPALSDARIYRDTHWIVAAYKKSVYAVLVYSLVVSVAIVFAGTAFLHLVFSSSYVMDHLTATSIAVYFFLSNWEFLNINFLYGLSMITSAAVGLLVRSVIALALTPLFVRAFGAGGAAVAMSLSIVLVTVWLYPYLVRRGVSRTHTIHGWVPTE